MSTSTKARPVVGEFVGRIGSLTITDRREFERAVPNYLGLNRHRQSFRIGDRIYLDFDGLTIVGDVWANAPAKGYWVRGDDGVTYLIGAKIGSGSRKITPTDSRGVALGVEDVRRIRRAA